MKNLLCSFCLLFLVLVSNGLQAQKNALNLDSYGVWIRGDAEYYKYFDDFKGVRTNYEWSDIQAKDSLHFNWDGFLENINYAYENDKHIYASILVGPDSPKWIYDNGVPKVFTEGGNKKWSYYPYYLDKDYERYLYKMINEFGSFLRSLPKHLTERISFVQITTGCTGDVDPYKGEPLNENYKISDEQWKAFYIPMFEQYKIAFNDGSQGAKIPLLFNGNAIHPESDAKVWEWVNNNIDPNIGFGIKGSAYMRAHHLTEEKYYNETWSDYILNPKGMQIFSRGEMDQTHEMMPVYQINKPLAFYWAMLNGLNTSLSVWDITESAIRYAAENPEVFETFRFFNKHAGNIFPVNASAAYSIFHEGLNSENTTKFPESEYGQATKANESRYEAICTAYAGRGAKMDHTYAATRGQVEQRHIQTGYNDAGWSIEEGNYERWIEQINPDETSKSLFRVRGEIDENSSIYDRFARSFDHAEGKDTMYFKFHDEVFSEYDPAILFFKITWLDNERNASWELRYDNGGETMALGKAFTGTGSNEWRSDTLTITDAVMKNGGPLGADFVLVNTDDLDNIFHGVEVDIVRVGDSDDRASIDVPHNGDEIKLGEPVPVTVSAYDRQGVEKVSISLNGGQHQSFSQAPYALEYNNLDLGTYTINATMMDSTGRSVKAAPVNFRIVPQSDTLTILSPSNGDTLLQGEDHSVESFYYDADGIKELAFSVDGGNFFFIEEEPYRFSLSFLEDGEHSIQAQMEDLLGNIILSETVTITIITLNDYVKVLSPQNGDTIFLGESLTVTTESYDKEGIERIRFRLDNASNWDNVLAPPYHQTYHNLELGEHLIEVQMKDLEGNRVWAENITVTVVAKDTVSISAPADREIFPLDSAVQVVASCYDSQGIKSVELRFDDGEFFEIAAPSYTFTLSDLDEGWHVLRVRMTDLLDNALYSEETSFQMVHPDSVVITSPFSGASYNEGEAVLVEASCFDYDGIKSVGFKLDDGEYKIAPSKPYQYTFHNLSEGSHSIIVQMTDSLDNSMQSETVSIMVYASDSIVINILNSADTITLGEELVIVATCYDRDGIETVGFRLDGEAFNTVEALPYEYTFTDLSIGRHIFVAEMTDLLGNSLFSDTVSIQVIDSTKTNAVFQLENFDETISLYPTLVDKYLYFKAKVNVEEIHVVDFSGKKIISKEITMNEPIDLACLKKGAYFVCFKNKHFASSYFKILKK